MGIIRLIYICRMALFMMMLKNVCGRSIYNCADFGAYQTQCDTPGSLACDVPYESESYCIAKCSSSPCSDASDAAHIFKEIICHTWGNAADFISTNNNITGLAIHRNKISNCSTYKSRTFNYIPCHQEYP